MIEIVNRENNIFGDNIAFVEQWDFSHANTNEDNRIKAILKLLLFATNPQKH